jgi:hypothetical protein
VFVRCRYLPLAFQIMSGRSGWKQGWLPDSQTRPLAPRYTVSQSGKHQSLSLTPVAKSENFNLTSGGGFRSTWFEQHVLKQRNPGPGRYRTDQELVDPGTGGKDAVDVNRTVKESMPRFSVPKLAKETTLAKTKLSILKPSYLNVSVGKSTDVQVTPGPGQYSQYTYFGAASGASRKPYF